MKKLTTKEVQHVVKLASLDLTDSQIEKFADQLSEVIDYNVQLLAQVNTDGVEPLYQVNDETNKVRPDEASPSLSQDQVLKNAASEHNFFFKVKAVIDE